MLTKIKFSQEAAVEFREATQWYESKSSGLGLRFTDEIDSTIERIKLNPELYQCIFKEIRRIQVNKFPFSLFYQIEGDTLIILRIFHHRRKPIEW